MHPSCGSFLLCSDWVAFLQVHFFRFSNFCVSYSTHQPSNMLWSGFLLGLQDWYLFPWWSGWQAPEPWLMWLMNLKVLICCCLPRSTKSVVVVDGLRGEQQRIARSRRLYKQHASCRTKSDITWNIMRSHGTPRMHLSCGSFLPCHDWIFFKYRVGLGAKLELECTILPKLVAVVTSPTYQCCERVRINGSPHVGRLITMKWYTRVPVWPVLYRSGEKASPLNRRSTKSF